MIFPPGSLVFDIGAHYGESSELFVAAGAGKVVAVEACWENYTELLQKVDRNKVIPLHAAAWSRSTIHTLQRAGNQTGLTSLLPEKWGVAYPDAGFEPPQHVSCVTLNSLAEVFGMPYYVKIDVEGAERQVLEGMSFLPPVFSFEFHQTYLSDALDILRSSEEQGYKKAWSVENNIDPTYETEEMLGIAEVAEQHAKTNPLWGNITCFLYA